MKKLGSAILLVIVGMLMLSSESDSQDRTQARSMVITQNGIVAAESPLAAQAGAQILARGGHAVDAAIAANAVMGLVAPMSNGIGGDLFAIVYDAKTGKLYGLNSSGWAPANLNAKFLLDKGITEMPQRGIHAVTVPGAVEGWSQLLAKFGRLKLADDLAPAIHYAERGFPVTEFVSGLWASSERRAKEDPGLRQTYYPGGRVPKLGEIFHNPDLAWTYKQIAAHGRDAYYSGEIAKKLLDFMRQKGGTMTAADLAEFSAEWVEPISTTYRGWTVYEIPPNGQGIAALMMLNIAEKFTISEYGHNSARALHTLIEAKKLAYTDMLRYVADPKFSKVPVAGMLSKDYARERGKLIDAAKANCSPAAGKPPGPGGDTVYLTVVDREGNMVSLIQSNYSSVGFGTGLSAPGTGFALQNRGALFSLDPNHPNVLAGRKRPLHTIIPAFMEKGDVRIAFGIMGGWNQSQAHAQFVSNVVDHGMNIQAALEAARFTMDSFTGCELEMEARIPAAVRAELETRGHKIILRGDFSPQMGGGQAVLRDFAAKVNYGASDPRKDGAAIPEPPPNK
ncbi:MAG: gamma-glutamyltransferase [Acidobacteria bacterium]|nr:gamma-glutamyltransferase [Acidobacteriota bacterium]MCL5288930.1 gamma-glutamyltransferase [Acidobacteriota bacterium]